MTRISFEPTVQAKWLETRPTTGGALRTPHDGHCAFCPAIGLPARSRRRLSVPGLGPGRPWVPSPLGNEAGRAVL